MAETPTALEKANPNAAPSRHSSQPTVCQLRRARSTMPGTRYAAGASEAYTRNPASPTAAR